MLLVPLGLQCDTSAQPETKSAIEVLLFGEQTKSVRRNVTRTVKRAAIKGITGDASIVVGERHSATVDGVTYKNCEVVSVEKNNDAAASVVSGDIRLAKIAIVAAKLGHSQLIDLVDSFVGIPAMRRFAILPCSAPA